MVYIRQNCFQTEETLIQTSFSVYLCRRKPSPLPPDHLLPTSSLLFSPVPSFRRLFLQDFLLVVASSHRCSGVCYPGMIDKLRERETATGESDRQTDQNFESSFDTPDLLFFQWDVLLSFNHHRHNTKVWEYTNNISSDLKNPEALTVLCRLVLWQSLQSDLWSVMNFQHKSLSTLSTLCRCFYVGHFWLWFGHKQVVSSRVTVELYKIGNTLTLTC